MALITTLDALNDLVEYYRTKAEFAFDVETIGANRDNPHVATVPWISLATVGRVDVIPMGHPHGELMWEGPAILLSGQRKLDAGKSRDDLKPTDFSKVKTERRFGPAPAQLGRGEVFSALEPLFFSDAVKIGHNIRFDLHAIRKYYGGETPPGPYYDTLIASWLLDVTRKGRLSLADCMKREFGETLVKGVGKDISPHPYSEVAKYSRLDSEATWRLKQELDRQYRAASPKTSMLLALEMQVLDPVLDMEATGVRIDMDAITSIDADLRKSLDDLRADIYTAAGRKFNVRSNKDKQELIFGPKSEGGQGLKPLRIVESSQSKPKSDLTIYDYAVDHYTLDQYRSVSPLVNALVQFSTKDKLHGTYVLPYLGGYAVRDDDEKPKYIESRLRGGRIYGQFRQFGTESGRFSSREPNLQNIPSRSPEGKRLREIFIADEGHSLIVADYSQIEPRLVASLSGDKMMIGVYNDGGDVYQAVADRMTVTRADGKELVLSITYGVGHITISERIGCTPQEARDLMNFFNRKFPSIIAHKNHVVAKARADRYAETILGRRRPLPRLVWRDAEERSGAERQAYNHVIQGSAADIMKIALVNVHAMLPPEASLLMTVHDEVVVQAPDDMVDDVMALVRREMEGAKPRSIAVPLVADVKSGHSWAEGK